MKLNPILALVAIVFAGLIFYGFYAAKCTLILSLIAAISSAFYMTTMCAVSYINSPRGTTLLRVSSATLSLLVLIFNIISAAAAFAEPVYVIGNSICFLLWLILLYAFGKANL